MSLTLLARRLSTVTFLCLSLAITAAACARSDPKQPTATFIATAPVASNTPALPGSSSTPLPPTLTPTKVRPTSVSQVEVIIDATKKYQTMEGFGATTLSLAYEGVGDTLSPSLRTQALNAIYSQVKINLGELEGALLESPGNYEQRTNDDNDPFHINWSGFQTRDADTIKQLVIDPAARSGFDDYVLGQKINVRWASPWLDAIRTKDYNRYLDEAAEQLAAGMIYWRDTLGITPKYEMPFNEPLGGNRELLNGTGTDAVDLVKRVGARLRREGFDSVKLVIPNEQSEDQSLATATAILSDPQARQYVGAIGYHPYPYGSTYASIPNILNTSGQGKPNSNRMAVRQQLRDLGKQYSIPVWMTEVSHGDIDPRSFDGFLGRAIHIHDELVYADAAAFFGMYNMWDTTAQKLHFGNNDLFDPSNEGHIVLVDNVNNTVTITGMGYAIGHYARWIKKGAVRNDATSNDPLVQVTSFWDNRENRMALVAINSATTERSLTVSVKGLKLNGNVTGEQSTRDVYWQSLAAFTPNSSGSFATVMPPKSVMTLVLQAVEIK